METKSSEIAILTTDKQTLNFRKETKRLVYNDIDINPERGYNNYKYIKTNPR